MTAAPGKWADLRQRVLSAVAMLVVGVLGVWAGGVWFHLLLSVICGAMVWELARMLGGPAKSWPVWLGAASTVALFASSYAPGIGLPLLLVPAFVGIGQLPRGRHGCLSSWLLLMWLDILRAKCLAGRNSGPRSARKRRGRALLQAGLALRSWVCAT